MAPKKTSIQHYIFYNFFIPNPNPKVIGIILISLSLFAMYSVRGLPYLITSSPALDSFVRMEVVWQMLHLLGQTWL